MCVYETNCSSLQKLHVVRVFFPTSRWTCCRCMFLRHRSSPVRCSIGRRCQRARCCHVDITAVPAVQLTTRRHVKWSPCHYNRPYSSIRQRMLGSRRRWSCRVLATLPNNLPLRYEDTLCCCCCDSQAALLLSSVVQVEEVCDRSRVVPQVLHCKLRRMALTVEPMFYGVCYCHYW